MSRDIDKEARVRLARFVEAAVAFAGDKHISLRDHVDAVHVDIEATVRRDDEDRLWLRTADGRCYLLQVIPVSEETFSAAENESR